MFWFFVVFFALSVPVGGHRCSSVDFGGFFGSSLFFFVLSVPVGGHRCRRWIFCFSLFFFVSSPSVAIGAVGGFRWIFWFFVFCVSSVFF